VVRSFARLTAVTTANVLPRCDDVEITEDDSTHQVRIENADQAPPRGEDQLSEDLIREEFSRILEKNRFDIDVHCESFSLFEASFPVSQPVRD
jgi:hypothetical protein